MSLVSTLGRLAVGIVVAKGVGKVLGGSRGRSSGGGGLGDLLGSVLGGGGAASGGGGLGGALGGGSGANAGGGLGDLGALLGGRSDSQGRQGPAGGLGGLLESLGGGGAAGAAGAGGLGGLLNDALAGKKAEQPTPDAEAQAEVLIRAMINAAKCDGSIDQAEQKKLLEHLGDVSDQERQFVMAEMKAPLDVNSFVASVSSGTEQQVYMMSLMAIDLDNKAEAQYLDQLRKGLNISEQACNSMHQQLGAPVLYS